MGGYGSGRPAPGFFRKQDTDPLPALDVRALKRRGWFAPSPKKRRIHPFVWFRGQAPIAFAVLLMLGGRNRPPHTVRLRYGGVADNGEPEVNTDEVTIEYTPCHYGGVRPWFRCPGCGQRRAILWLAGGWFRCMQCHGLVYSSTREGVLDRACRRAHRARAKLCAGYGPVAVCPPKPKGMHWTTYLRMCNPIIHARELFSAEIDALEDRCARIAS